MKKRNTILKSGLFVMVTAVMIVALGVACNPKTTATQAPAIEKPAQESEPVESPEAAEMPEVSEASWEAPTGLETWTEEDVEEQSEFLRTATDQEIAAYIKTLDDKGLKEVNALLDYIGDQELTTRVVNISKSQYSAGDEPWRMKSMDGSTLLFAGKDGEPVPADLEEIVTYMAKAQAIPAGYYVEIYTLPLGTEVDAVKSHYIDEADTQGMKKARDTVYAKGDVLVTWVDPDKSGKKYTLYFYPATPPFIFVMYSNPE